MFKLVKHWFCAINLYTGATSSFFNRSICQVYLLLLQVMQWLDKMLKMVPGFIFKSSCKPFSIDSGVVHKTIIWRYLNFFYPFHKCILNNSPFDINTDHTSSESSLSPFLDYHTQHYNNNNFQQNIIIFYCEFWSWKSVLIALLFKKAGITHAILLTFQTQKRENILSTSKLKYIWA